MYKIEFSDKAYKDLDEISDYISDELLNPVAAINLIDELEATIKKRLELFPYAYPVHTFLEILGIEYRRTVIKNITVFYKISEIKRDDNNIDGVVTITHIVNSNRDVEKIVIND